MTGWKVWAIVALITLGFVLIFNYFSEKSFSLKPNPSNTPQAINSWQIYKGSNYSISYPPETTLRTNSLEGGGSQLTLTLPDSNYKIDLQVIPNTITSVEKMSLAFRSLKYAESTITINNKPATAFKGSFKLGTQTSQESAVILENNGQIFSLDLSYDEEQRNVPVDEIFAKVVDSLKFI